MNTKRTKILYLITKSNWGGAQRYVFDLATHLPERFEPVVALGGNGVLAEKLTEHGVRTISIQSLDRDINLKREVATFREIARIVKEEAPDILHVNSSKAGGIGAFFGRVYGIPHVIFTAHGWAFNEDRPWWQKPVVGFFHWLTIMCAHTTIAVSHGLKTQMRWPFTKRRMRVVNPGREAETTFPRDEARQYLTNAIDTPVHTDSLWIGTIAELHPIKRLTHAIDAVAALKDDFPGLTYFIIGGGELEEELRTYIKSKQLTNHVILAGVHAHAATLLTAFDVFCLPSKSESYGYVLVEAGHAGLPVVATNTGGIPDTVTDGQSGLLVPPDDPAALRTALHTLLSSPEKRREYGTALKAVAAARSVPHMVAETVAIYDV